MEIDLLKEIGNNGFAIGVAAYSLVVLNRTIAKNTKVLTQIATRLEVKDGDS